MATGRIGTTPVLTTRWSKAPAAGTTSLSGLDDNSVSLVYSVGYEAVYQNGVLLSRGNDYTATNGTTITLTTATVAGDIIEVFANQTIPLTDTYSQTVANSLFVNQATFDAKGDLIAGTADNTYSRLAVGANNTVLTADSTTATGLKWATPSSASTLSLITSGTMSGSTVTISSLSSYDQLYFLIYDVTQSVDSQMIFRINGSSSSIYNRTAQLSRLGTTSGSSFTGLTNGITMSPGGTGYDVDGVNGAMASFTNCKNAGYTRFQAQSAFRENAGSQVWVQLTDGVFESNAAVSSMSIVSNGSSFTGGSYYVYGA